MMEYPALIISHDLTGVYESLRESGLVVNIVSSVEDLRDFMHKYYGVRSSSPIILSDISKLGYNQARILKFIEESQSPIICISSEDNISQVLLSRFATIRKIPLFIKNEKDRPSLIKDKLREEGESLSIEESVKYAPSAYPIIESLRNSNMPAKDKIIQLVFS